MKSSRIFLAYLILSAFIATLTYAQDYERKSLNVTVYNNNLGVIKDVRNINIEKGVSNIKVTDVAEKIDPTSVNIKLNGTVLEQNYQYDLVSLNKILEKYIDKEITLLNDKTVISGTLLSCGSNIVLRKKDGGLLMLPKIDDYQISVGTLPQGLITMPTLVWTVDSKSSGKQDVEMSYMTEGMGWHAEYVAVLNDKDTKMDLKSWVSINNMSGATYPNADLKLIAGDVNRVQDMPPPNVYRAKMYAEAVDAAAQQFEEKSFFEYHIYTLQRPTTLSNNETKQISLFEADNVQIKKKYIYKSGWYSSDKKVQVAVEFFNKKDNNLGVPMPKGKVRLYKSEGTTVEFIGEDQIDHTPKDENVTLKVGDAFDIKVEDIEKDQKRISDKVADHSYEITIKNKKDEDVVVEVEKYLGYNWEMLESSISFEKKNAMTVVFKVPVKKDKETKLTFKVRYSN
ncbi:MAG: DUF4139 domain-containing protein [Bacteroidota bacterium]